MTAAEAKRIIHPETTVEALAEIKDKNAKVAAKAERNKVRFDVRKLRAQNHGKRL